MNTCRHGYLEITCPRCKDPIKTWARPTSEFSDAFSRPGAALAAAFGVTPQPSGHSDERGTIDLNEVLAEASERAAQTSRREEH